MKPAKNTLLFIALMTFTGLGSMICLIAIVRLHQVPAKTEKDFILSLANSQHEWMDKEIKYHFAIAQCCERRSEKSTVLQAIQGVKHLVSLRDSALILLEKITMCADDATLAQSYYIQYRAFAVKIQEVINQQLQQEGRPPLESTHLFNPNFFNDDLLVPATFFGNTESAILLSVPVLEDHLNFTIRAGILMWFDYMQGCSHGCDTDTK